MLIVTGRAAQPQPFPRKSCRSCRIPLQLGESRLCGLCVAWHVIYDHVQNRDLTAALERVRRP
jgi:hypothetical protein